ncbi:MAG: hypothetical protein ACHQ4H_05880 [Ktedonobacterales bacterium]
MTDLDIHQLVWDDWNRGHIWDRHQLTPEVVEEVCYGDAEKLYAEQTYGGRYLLVGPRRGGKLFAVVLAPKGAGQYYPVSARRASQKERRAYRAWKAEKEP